MEILSGNLIENSGNLYRKLQTAKQRFELTSITIPKSVTTIRIAAFEHCENLTGVTIMARIPPAIDRVNNFMVDNDTLYVPAGCADAYRNSTWGELFTTITEQ